jgi:LysM repeat protein
MTLQELYDKIKNQSPLRLIPDVLTGDNIAGFYTGWLPDGTFIVDGPVVTKEEKDGAILKVTIEGKTTSFALEGSLGITMDFTEEFSELKSTLNAKFGENTLNLPAVWFDVQDVQADMEVADSAQPIKGTLSGEISVLSGIRFSIGFPVYEERWLLQGTFKDPKGLADLFNLVARVDLRSYLPPFLKTVLDLRVKQVGLLYDAKNTKLEYINLKVGTPSDYRWEILPRLAVQSLDLDGTVISPGTSDYSVTYTVFGQFQIGQQGTQDGIVVLSASMPNLLILGNLRPGSKLYLRDLLSLFLPGVVTPDFDSAITKFSIRIDPTNRIFFISGEITAEWSIPLGITTLTIKTLSANLQYMNANTTGGLAGRFAIGDEGTENPVELIVAAEHPRAGGGWTFKGELADGSQIKLQQILDRFFGAGTLPAPGDITVTRLKASINSQTKDYMFDISISWGRIFGESIPLDIKETSAFIQSDSSGRSGKLKGVADFKGVEMEIAYTFGGDQNDVTFKIFDILFTINTKKPPYILKIEPKGKSLGDLVTFLINAVVPGQNITLPAPWSVLNTISLDGFTFYVNFTDKKVGFDYQINVNLGFVNIKSLTLNYYLDSSKVLIGLEGSFLGGAAPMPPPWDATKPDDAPAVPGKGSSIFKLEFLGLGQHVAIEGLSQPDSIAKAIEMLENAFTEAPDKPGSKLKFDQGINWLVGTKFIIIGTINLSIVFYDPEVYGLLLNVTGDKFKGLKFEVLYKKVNDNVGVYQINLTLPAFIRNMEFGALSITLPNIKLWIYTNGDFKIDFGFPKIGDFSQSFGIQYLPFIGAGGFYFGVLSGETSETVPKIDPKCGSFNPVIEFGVGLMLGIGKSIDKGIMKAGLSLSFQGILEGTIAFFNSYQPALTCGNLPAESDNRPRYYFVQGQIALVGKIYGEINFAIISASLDITITIAARVVLEAYQAMLINFSASVSVSLKVSINLGIFSISIRLSFNAAISQSFQLGTSDPQNAPWNCTRVIDARRPKLLRLDSPDNNCEKIAEMTWKPVYLAQGEKLRELEVLFVPQFTVGAEDGSAVATARGVAMLFVRSVPPEESESAETPFRKLARGILIWVFNAFFNKNVEKPTEKDVTDKEVTQDILQEIHCYFAQQQFASGDEDPFTLNNVIDFLSNYFEMQVTVPPETSQAEVSVMPILPLLSLTTPAGEVQFGDGASIKLDRKELEAIRKYFAELRVRYENRADKQTAALDETKKSLAEFLFVDFFAMIAKSAVQEAIDQMKATNELVPPRYSLSELVLAHRSYGVGETELAFTNRLRKLSPGTSLLIAGATATVQHGDTWESIADRHDIHPEAVLSHNRHAAQKGLRPGDTIKLPDLIHIARAGQADTLLSIAGAYNITVEQLAEKNRRVRNLFVSGKRVVFPNVEKMNVGTLLEKMDENNRFDHLAGLAARVLLQGLRPLSPVGSMYEGKPAALYQLSLQEFDASALAPGNEITLSITGGQPLEWLKLGTDGDRTSVGMTLTEKQVDWIESLAKTPLDPTVHSLVKLDLYDIKPKTFALSNQIEWKKSEPFSSISGLSSFITPGRPKAETLMGGASFPHGAQPLVAPAARTHSARQIRPALGSLERSWGPGPRKQATPASPEDLTNPSIWPFPPDLIRLLNLDKTLHPKLELCKEVQEHLNLLSDPIPVPDPKWSMMLDVTVGLVPGAQGGNMPGVYQMIGTGEAGSRQLESLLRYTATYGANIVGDLYVLYPEEPARAGQEKPPMGLKSDALADTNLFLLQANLSTISHPSAFRDATSMTNTQPNLIGMTVLDFVTLLWECSMVGTGGYYFNYEIISTKKGLPGYLFNESPTAKLTLLISLNIADGVVPDFVNSVVIKEAIDPKNEILYAQTVDQSVHGYRMRQGESLQDLARNFHVDLADLAMRNLGKRITTGKIGIPPRLDPPRNGGRERLQIPAMPFLNSERLTLASIAARFGVSPIALVHTNKSVPGFFDGPLDFNDQLQDKLATVPPGNVGFRMIRKNPADLPDDAQKQLQELYNLVEYKVADYGIFDHSNPALPAGPADQDYKASKDPDADTRPPALNLTQPWTYEGVLPVFPFVNVIVPPVEGFPDPQQSPYRGVRGAAKQEVQIHLNWLDVFGNSTASLKTTESAGAWPDLLIPVGYTDQLISVDQWRNVSPAYTIKQATDGGLLTVDFIFHHERYTEIEDEKERKEKALSDLEQFKLLYYQLLQPDAEVRLYCSLDDTTSTNSIEGLLKDILLTYSGQIFRFLRQVADGEPSPVIPENAKISRTVVDANPANIFALRVEIEIHRSPDLMDDNFRDVPTCSAVTSFTQPNLRQDTARATEEDPPLSLRDFAIEIQTAFPELKVLSGTPEAGHSEEHELWIARFANTPDGITFDITNRGNPLYFAIKPLSKDLITRNDVTTFLYQSGSFIGNAPTTRGSFPGVDLDLLASNFLQAVDQFLSAGYATAAWALEKRMPSPPAADPCTQKAPYETLLNAKKAIASAASLHLASVFEDQAYTPDQLKEAQGQLEQQILIQLSNAYTINTVVQFNVCVRSKTGKPANLFGKPVKPDVPQATADENRDPYSLSGSKIALSVSEQTSCTQPGASNSYLTFMFTARSPEDRSYFVLPLVYEVNALEHDIADVPQIPGYTASSWLSFVLPFEAAGIDPSLGQLAIPVPLRAYPTAPSLMDHQAEPQEKQFGPDALRLMNGPEELEKAKQWKYRFVYDYRGAGQDTIHSNVRLNVAQSSLKASMFRDEEDPDLFAALVQFSQAYPAILEDLDKYLLIGANDDKAWSALRSFAWLVCRTGNAWTRWEQDRLSYGDLFLAQPEYEFEITQSPYVPPSSVDTDTEERLKVTVDLKSDMPEFPVVEIEGYDPVPPPGPDETGKISFLYIRKEDPPQPEPKYLGYEEGVAKTTRTVQLENKLDVLKEENAWAGISVIRNQHLDPGETREVNPDFIYKTPIIRFINVVTPLLDPAVEINIAEFTPPPAGGPQEVSLKTYLSNFFRVFFREVPVVSGATRTITLGCNYRYDLQPPSGSESDAMRVLVPVFLTLPYPFQIPQDWDPDQGNFVNLVAESITDWLTRNTPSSDGARLYFDLSLFSSLSDSKLPVLRLRKLYLSI